MRKSATPSERRGPLAKRSSPTRLVVLHAGHTHSIRPAPRASPVTRQTSAGSPRGIASKLLVHVRAFHWKPRASLEKPIRRPTKRPTGPKTPRFYASKLFGVLPLRLLLKACKERSSCGSGGSMRYSLERWPASLHCLLADWIIHLG